MKASVIVINYNNGKYIDKCIKSLITQSYKNIEIIFVDDNSNDNSLIIAKKYKKKIKIIKKIKKIGNGSFDQMFGFFEGYKKTTGDIIFLLDSDDYFHKDKISTIMKEFKNNEDKMIIYDLPIKFYRNNYSIIKFKKNIIFKNFWTFFVPTSCISIKKKLFLKLFKKVNFKTYPNIWFDFRISFSAIYLYNQYNFVKQNLTYYRQSNNNVSSKFTFLSKNWWQRRLEAHEFVEDFFKRNKIIYKKNLDYFLTKFMNFFN